GSFGMGLVANSCPARSRGLATDSGNQPRHGTETHGRHVVVDAFVTAGRDEIRLVPDADIAARPDAFVELHPSGPMDRFLAARIGLQVLEGTPVLNEHRPPWASGVSAGTKEP